MKRNLLVVVALLLATSMSAQLYVGGRLGYGFGSQKTVIGMKMKDKSIENIWGSMGQGFPMGIKAGFFFNDNLGFELGINYWFGATKTRKDITLSEYELVSKTGVIVYDFSNLTTAKSSQLRILPQLVYKSDMGIYGRFGLIIPVSGKTTVNDVTKYKMKKDGDETVKEVVTIYKGAFSMGFAGALGYSFELSDNLFFFGEIEYIGLSINSKSSEITSTKTNGTENVSAMTTIQTTTNYVDVLDSKSTISADKPSQSLSTSTGYSATRINFGVTFIIE